MPKTLVLAEPGCTAQGNFEAMLKLIDCAADCGADVFKTTWVSSSQKLADRRKAAAYKPYYDWHAWPVSWHLQFRERCETRGIKYACTADLPEDVVVLEPLVDYLKIASFHATDREILAALTGIKRERVIISVGMCSEEEIRPLVGKGFLLHCTSKYPAPAESMNLSVLKKLWCAGLSDHSRQITTGAMAVALGARIIETHYRLYDCEPKNPDVPVAFAPLEFKAYVDNIRTAEAMMGSPLKQLQECEREMSAYRVA